MARDESGLLEALKVTPVDDRIRLVADKVAIGVRPG
jgi:hypothetical protein